MIDTHLHTEFSDDSEQPPLELIARAKDSGQFELIIITDHVDKEYFNPKVSGVKDFDKYFATLADASAALAFRGKVAFGIELGFTEKNRLINGELARTQPFEYIINSVHEVDKRDCYFPAYFEGMERDEAYMKYFRAVLKSVSAPYAYSTLGHLAYVERNAPFEDTAVKYSRFEDVLDEILTGIIKREVSLELNTSSAKASTPIIPNAEILARYYSLGGRLITCGSDAHRAVRLGDKYAVAVAAARKAGFRNWSVKFLRGFGTTKEGIREFGF
ncbi:MAG: histidinol-phosphatase HisJ family protein [Clostridiales bacterium]|jgi:histidinol-phosphatase (PHP family)|nr:histidinol-phosphatase HisJ family protein [Clostridiales bacterium]